MLTHEKLSNWPAKGNLPSVVLSTRYSILHKIGIYNWLPWTHKSAVTKTFASLIFLIGTKQSFNLGHMMLDHILCHAKSRGSQARDWISLNHLCHSLQSIWFKVAVSVIDSNSPETYQSRCIGCVSADTQNRMIKISKNY